MLAVDCFRVNRVVTPRRLYLRFVLEFGRDLHVRGVTAPPDGSWTTQQAQRRVFDSAPEYASEIKDAVFSSAMCLTALREFGRYRDRRPAEY